MATDCRENIVSEDYVDFIIEYNSLIELEELGYCFTIISNTLATIYVPREELTRNFIHTFGYNAIPLCFGLMDIASSEASGVSALRNIPVLNLRGQGVLIGIVDTGVDYTHQAFLNEDGTSRILSIWDQTIQDGTPPEGMNFGSNYTNEQINEALQTDDPLTVVPTKDEEGHGTFLAGVAGGNYNANANFTGIAPDSEIVVVKLKKAKAFLKEFFRIPQTSDAYQQNDCMLAVTYLINVAFQYGRPISICFGLGTSSGAHDDRGQVSSFLNEISRINGVALSVPAGNEGNRGHHFSGIVEPPRGRDLVELRVGPNETGFTMELWGNTPSTFSIDILSPTGEYISRIPARINESREIRFMLEKTIVNVDYFLIASEAGDQMILLRFLNPTEGIWRFHVYATGDLELSYNIWLPITQFISENTFFIEPDPTTTLTAPGNTIHPMTVTAYDVANNSLYLSASKGFTRTGQIKPDFAAPGVNMIGPSLNNGYTRMSGTSVATAHNTGISALLLEWGINLGNSPQMTNAQIKNILIRGATRSPQTRYPNEDWGYGRINIYNSFANIRGNI